MTGNTFEVSGSRCVPLTWELHGRPSGAAKPAAVATHPPLSDARSPTGSWGPSDSWLLDAWLSSQQ